MPICVLVCQNTQGIHAVVSNSTKEFQGVEDGSTHPLKALLLQRLRSICNRCVTTHGSMQFIVQQEASLSLL